MSSSKAWAWLGRMPSTWALGFFQNCHYVTLGECSSANAAVHCKTTTTGYYSRRFYEVGFDFFSFLTPRSGTFTSSLIQLPFPSDDHVGLLPLASPLDWLNAPGTQSGQPTILDQVSVAGSTCRRAYYNLTGNVVCLLDVFLVFQLHFIACDGSSVWLYCMALNIWVF